MLGFQTAVTSVPRRPVFDLATLDGIFRAVAFCVAGRVQLALGAYDARGLARK